MMKIMMTGSRIWTDYQTIYDALLSLRERCGPYTLLSGNAKGADKLAEKAGDAISGITVQRYPADWKVHNDDCWCGKANLSYCRFAGFRRNQKMIEEGPDLIVAFWKNKSSGTKDAIDRAKKAGIPVKIYES